MASPSIYAQMVPSLDGQLLAEATSVETSIENKDTDVETLIKDWAGITPSPKVRRTSVENMELAAGVEFPFEEKELTNQIVELGLQMFGSGQKLASRGFLRNVRKRAGVGQNLIVSFEHIGEPTKFE